MHSISSHSAKLSEILIIDRIRPNDEVHAAYVQNELVVGTNTILFHDLPPGQGYPYERECGSGRAGFWYRVEGSE